MVHRAKVDTWLAAVLGGAVVLEVVVGAALIGSGLLLPALIPAAVGLLVGMLLWACYRTSYEVTPSELVIRFGPVRTTLAVAGIIAVTPTRDPTSALAPSLDRLRIDYRRADSLKWYALISPREKDAFIRDLAQVAPQLQR
jgi:hypothetical protein